jgi:chemotaxis protein histidine kinase CheA/CheY-like chemotaxis protein
MDDFEKQLLAVFRDEVAEFLDQLALNLDIIKTKSVDKRKEAIHESFRIVHNIKGAARTVGLESIENISHAMEDALNPFRKSNAKPSDLLIEQLLEGITIAQRLSEGEDIADAGQKLIKRLSEVVTKVQDKPRRKKRKTTKPAPASIEDRDKETELSPVEEDASKSEYPFTGEENVDTTSQDQAELKSEVGKDVGVSVRIETARLDHLMAYAGELLVVKARMASRNQLIEQFKQSFHDAYEGFSKDGNSLSADLVEQLDHIIQFDRKELLSFGHLTDEIGSAMKRVRMLPLSGVAPVWRRIVRENAQELQKKAELTIEVGDLELDKYILDNLRDPFMHLLRNAIDHGIEPPKERIASGKSETGSILIKATMAGAMIKIEVSDDGRGLDPEKIGKAAFEKGIIGKKPIGDMADQEILNLLFSAGFSTRKKVSHLSGRGVGLDVVRQRVEEIGGSVDVSTTPTMGGTTFYLTLPVSILSIKGLLVDTGKSICALPIDCVVRTLRVDKKDFKQVDGSPAIVMEDSEPLRISFLSSLMNEKFEVNSRKLNVVIVTRAGAQLGLVVKEVIGEQEFVTKKLPWNLKRVSGINGAVILGDGTLAIVVDVPYLFESAAAASEVIVEEKPTAGKKEIARILVVDDSLTSRTLERNTLLSAGFDVLVAVDGEEGWKLLQEQKVNLAIIDVKMPVLDGLELTRRIRRDANLKHLPVVLVTALDSQENLAEGAEAGADEYIVKGQFDQQKLLEAVARLI